MFALLALVAFILSPFIKDLGPWPMVTVGLALLALHFVWTIVLPIGPRRTTVNG